MPRCAYCKMNLPCGPAARTHCDTPGKRAKNIDLAQSKHPERLIRRRLDRASQPH